MKIRYEQSIKEQLDQLAHEQDAGAVPAISCVELSESEYIQLLEELGPSTARICMKMPGEPRRYKGLVLKVLMA